MQQPPEWTVGGGILYTSIYNYINKLDNEIGFSVSCEKLGVALISRQCDLSFISEYDHFPPDYANLFKGTDSCARFQTLHIANVIKHEVRQINDSGDTSIVRLLECC